VFSFFSASFPQYMMKVDNDLAQQRNIYWECNEYVIHVSRSNYEISFIKYGINYKVIVQASPEYRALPEDILKLYVKMTEMKWSLILLSWS
jgi:HAE1 family hydrophobic/amphiphilic exporter-1